MENINLVKYSGSGGAKTRKWGPSLWNFLFTAIISRYPMKIDIKNEEHILIREEFKHLLTSLSIILPCIFCRESYKGFLEELPIKKYLNGRIELMYWLYKIKDKVNIKLIKQERECYIDEIKKFKDLYNNKKISKEEYYNKKNKAKNEIFLTVPSPPFREVLDKYEENRATCSKKAKKCI